MTSILLSILERDPPLLLSWRFLHFFPPKSFFYIFGEIFLIRCEVKGQRCHMFTDCKALWGKFLICDIGPYKINWRGGGGLTGIPGLPGSPSLPGAPGGPMCPRERPSPVSDDDRGPDGPGGPGGPGRPGWPWCGKRVCLDYVHKVRALTSDLCWRFLSPWWDQLPGPGLQSQSPGHPLRTVTHTTHTVCVTFLSPFRLDFTETLTGTLRDRGGPGVPGRPGGPGRPTPGSPCRERMQQSVSAFGDMQVKGGEIRRPTFSPSAPASPAKPVNPWDPLWPWAGKHIWVIARDI